MQIKRTTLATMTAITLALAGVSAAAFAQGAGDRPAPGADFGPGFGRGFGPGGPHGGFGFERAFAEIDADKDGKITKAEVESWQAAQPKVEDGDGDGKISAEELAAPRIAEATKRAQDQAAHMVRELDRDGDGLLSAAELAQGPGMAGPGMTGPGMAGPGRAPDLDKLFDRLDADKDGAVSLDEAQDAMARMHDRKPGDERRPGSDRGKGPRGEHDPRGEHGPRGEHERGDQPPPPADQPQQDD